jgi:hypothetical protein
VIKFEPVKKEDKIKIKGYDYWGGVRVIMFNATFNNISVISWWSV